MISIFFFLDQTKHFVSSWALARIGFSVLGLSGEDFTRMLNNRVPFGLFELGCSVSSMLWALGWRQTYEVCV